MTWLIMQVVFDLTCFRLIFLHIVVLVLYGRAPRSL